MLFLLVNLIVALENYAENPTDNPTESFAPLEAHAEAYAEAERYVVAAGTEDIPQGEAVVVARLGRGAERIACTGPGIDEKAAEVGLIACRSEQGTHLGLRAEAGVALVVPVGDIDEFGTHIESTESACLVACYEELMSVAQGIAARVVLKLVVPRTDEAGAYLARLMASEGSFIGELGTACDPG